MLNSSFATIAARVALSACARPSRSIGAVPFSHNLKLFLSTTTNQSSQPNTATARHHDSPKSSAAAAAARSSPPSTSADEPTPPAPVIKDHREIGQAQKLFMFHDLSPGSAFFLPHGTRMVHKLMDLMRAQYRKFGYDEVITPQLYKRPLWQQSGHWDNYKDDMFAVLPGQGDNKHAPPQPQGAQDATKWEAHDGCAHHAHAPDAANDQSGLYGLKPMNCPGHCLLFKSTRHSYKDLPLRIADFSPLHRNEASGALSGLTRVRRFHQDDAHIFCTTSQVADEIRSTLAMIDQVYSLFGFAGWEFMLSTRPDKYLGNLDQWDAAERALREALDSQVNTPWKENPGDGAFYGPKIDIRVRDAAGRMHQTATVQLDFQLPERFGLKYELADNSQDTPVMIHRAVLGSVERMLAILAEHYQGKWPFWLSPRQVMVIPVHQKREHLVDYAVQVRDVLRGTQPLPSPHPTSASGKPTRWQQAVQKQLLGRRLASPVQPLAADVDLSSHTLKEKVRLAHDKGYSYVVMVGEREAEMGTVTMRPLVATAVGEEERQFASWDVLLPQARGTRLATVNEMAEFFYLIGEKYVQEKLREGSPVVQLKL
ncbi:hypothetical protein BCR44DRAFT_129365 [Catenaria anguillulae PL171]|uniref:threonine--tRNA ligase n=1 Tax=Catenaria anguillulae PL171 TaxID=765915 RepID=A0A1Y2I3P3_9FUNG|nr:hypothetical protein BCR44DRAFT_129365 [Catenaria anguillulae PL171]